MVLAVALLNLLVLAPIGKISIDNGQLAMRRAPRSCHYRVVSPIMNDKSCFVVMVIINTPIWVGVIKPIVGVINPTMIKIK